MARHTNTRDSRPVRLPFDFDIKFGRGACGKNRYGSREDAELVLAIARGSHVDGVSSRREERIYRCDRCNGGFHLTSQEYMRDTPPQTR